MIKPWPLRPAVPGGFTLDDFTVDEAAGTATCPNGLTRPISRTRVGHLRRRPAAAARCGLAAPPPPAGAACTCTRTTRCSGRIGPAPPTRTSRPPTAGTGRWSNARIAWLTRGNRRVPYRGVIKNDAWLHLRAAAINLRRLLNLGLTGTDGHWALAS